jgi:hypothetical protein
MQKSLYGQLAVTPHQSQAQLDLIGLINDRIKPPTHLSLDDVHVRALRLVSDQVNDHGGRFPREEHERLCELLIDSPVMIGHDHSSLPVARNFAARCVDEGERSWVEVWFYWLKGDGPHHDQLAADIDAGVVKEGSIGFEFALPQCSICAEDIRTCEHIPGFDYNGSTAHYEYRNIQRVLETSLVYRGATPGTHIVKYPIFTKLESAVVEGERPREPALLSQPTFTTNHAPPAHARLAPSVAEGAFLASFREIRSFYCPARHDLWPRSVYDFRAGHGPLALRSLGEAGPTLRMGKRAIR